MALLIALSAVTVALDTLVVSIFLPILLYIDGGASALQSRLPAPLSILYTLVSDSVAGVELPAMLFAATALMCFRYIMSYSQAQLSIDMAATATINLRSVIHRELLNSDLSHHTQNQSGNRFTSVIGYPQQIGGMMLMLAQLLVTFLLCFAYAALLLIVSPILAIAGSILFILIFGSYRRLLNRARLASEAYQKQTAVQNALLIEQLHGIRLIKLRGQEESMSEKFFRTTKKNVELYSKVLLAQSMVAATVTPLLMISGLGLVYAALVWMQTPAAQLGTFALAMLRLLPVLASLNTLRSTLHGYAPSLELYQAALKAARAEQRILSGSQDVAEPRMDVNIEEVCFSYPESTTRTLDSISFQIHTGQVVALIGRSGSGKSTIADMLARLHEPERGQIRINGTPLRDLKIDPLRKAIAVVSQESFLFDATVRENISFGLPHLLDNDELERVLRQAHALDFVMALPEGLDAMVGEKGIRLSGGQRQRLALARGLAQRPRLLILDEPTSALDSESEQEIQHALNDLHGEITMLIIAHRFDTIKHADIVYLVEDGRIAATGSHSELFASNDKYRALFGFDIE
ncbi:MAG: ABC transporter ATP-binding protein [Rhodocyclaceae bacterium]|nr:ABC transporter ATP-binding protein [Rhodocyclaceae bacterium]MDZ4215568.1 ABC transporter ATP-binding protein [Rhodocyclaceae bacterium]